MNIQVDCSGSSCWEFSFKKKSGHSQDDLVCRRLSIIFMDQGNISKVPARRRMCIIQPSYLVMLTLQGRTNQQCRTEIFAQSRTSQ